MAVLGIAETCDGFYRRFVTMLRRCISFVRGFSPSGPDVRYGEVSMASAWQTTCVLPSRSRTRDKEEPVSGPSPKGGTALCGS